MAYELGNIRRGASIALSNSERSTHLHVVGASGTGKSKFLESLIRQDILAGRGLCLIDPHGTLADDVVAWCASRQVDRQRKVHVITPSDLDWSVGFNPLRLDEMTEPSARVDAMVSACAQVWGGENMSSTPLLKRCLKAVFYVLAVRELTLVEATELISVRNATTLRRVLTEELPDPVFDAQWGDFNALSARDFLEQFSSTNNRLVEFLGSPVVRRVVGQRERVLDLRRTMDEGEVVILNLSPGGAISEENARLLGTLFASELFLLARSRTPETARRHPFTLYVDECYNFITNDIEKMLDQTRKFGLHVVLSHQRLGQLGPDSGPIYNGVMAGGQTKVVFGGLADSDAEVMARHVFRSSLNLERPKHVLDKPTVVGEVPYWLESESTSDTETSGSSYGSSSSWAQTSGRSEAESQASWVKADDPYSLATSSGSFEQSMSGGGSSSGSSYSQGTSVTRGSHQTLKPVREMLPTAVYSLEEELHLAIVKLRELPKQTAIVKRPAKPPVRIRPSTVTPPLVRRETVDAFLERTRTASPYISPTASVEVEISARRAAMGVERGGASASGADAFWHDE